MQATDDDTLASDLGTRPSRPMFVAVSNVAVNARISVLIGMLLVATGIVSGQEARPAPGGEPILRVDTGGPSSFVTSLAFSPDGRTLFAGGWDKVVRVWSLDEKDQFVPSPAAAFRVPVGPGQHGRINAIAVSPDGAWLAVGGTGNVAQKGVADFRNPGWILPSTAVAATTPMLLDEGTIYLFNLSTRAVRPLRHHRGAILSLAFSSPLGAQGPLLLASAAREWDEDSSKSKGVVCLWNVQEDSPPLAQTELKDPKFRPQLSVLRTGSGVTAVHVAIAWADGTLRLWNVEQGTSVPEQPDGQPEGNLTVRHLNASTIITGSVGRRVTAQLRAWSSTARSPLQLDLNRQKELDALSVPYALALLASVPGGAWDHAAVAILKYEGKPPRPRQMQLRVVSLKTPSFGQTVVTTGLWAVGPAVDLPVMAAVVGGRHLAVGGSPNHEIRVYSIGDLLAQKTSHQPLASRAVSIGSLAFAKKGPEHGLLLRKTDSPGDEFDLVFPLRSGQLQTFQPASGWKAETESWTTKHVGNQVEIFRNKVPYKTENQLGPPPPQRVTASSVGTPPSQSALPIVAIASEDNGQPLLGLYNGQTGARIREYTGHTGRITDVKFSPDSRLLASVSDDQTVCVWSLTDLDKILGHRGLLVGVALDRERKVAKIVQGTPAMNLLQEGDQLTGYISDNKFHEWKSSRAFYATWWGLKPGTTLTVRRQRGNQTQDIDLPVGQGIDERKPLFSLMVTRGNRPTDREQWIGWNPLGPFESSDRRIERYLGWHFNTGDPARPTAYAELDQYREEYFRRGLLRDLMRDGQLLPAPAPDPLDRPSMSLFLLGPTNVRLAAQDPLVVSIAPTSVRLAIDYAFPNDAIETVAWQVNDTVGGFELDTNGTWFAELPAAARKRGQHQVTVTLTTREATPQKFRQQLGFRYVPAKPIITAKMKTVAATKLARIGFPVDVKAGLAGELIDVQLHRILEDGVDELGVWSGQKQVAEKPAVSLNVGANVFELVAYNQNSRVGETRSEETSRERFVITHYSGDTAPPSIALTSLKPDIDGQFDGGEPIPLRPGLPTVVSIRRVQVEGKITSKEENLTRAEKIARKNQAGTSLPGFVTKQHKQFPFKDTVDLVPGMNTLSYRAEAENGRSETVDLEIEYRPPLPEVNIVTPSNGQTITQFMQAPNVLLEAHVARETSGALPAVVDGQVYVNGQRLDKNLVFDAEGAWKSSVPLRFGDNDITIRLKNQWGTTSTSRTTVSYSPAPKFAQPEIPETADKPIVDLAIRGWSETPIEKVIIDGHELSPGAYRTAHRGREFGVLIKGQSFGIQQETLALEIYAKGCPTPASRDIVLPEFVGQPPVPATIEITDPQRNATTIDPQYTIRFAVDSPSQLGEVALWQDGRLVPPETLKVVGESQWEADVSLQIGTNSFEVTAKNAGGIQKTNITLNRMAPPVSLVVKGFGRFKTSKLNPPGEATAGRLRFSQEATSHRVFLQGEVVWKDASDENIDKKYLQLNLLVNGYRQPPVWLDPREGQALRRSFTIQVILNKESGNKLELYVPDLKCEAASRLLLDIDCAAPLRKKRLHLLVVGVGETDNHVLVKNALKALNATPGRKTFSPAFEQGITYEKLAEGGPVNKDSIHLELVNIQEAVEQLLKTEGQQANDVVLVYYQGGELIYDGDRAYVTTQKNSRQGKVELKTFWSNFEKFCGAQLLLLDVAGQAEDGGTSVETWPTNSRAALLRYVWQDGTRQERVPLIDELDRVDPQSGELDQVANALRQFSNRFTGSLSYNGIVPPLLETLELKRATQP